MQVDSWDLPEVNGTGGSANTLKWLPSKDKSLPLTFRILYNVNPEEMKAMKQLNKGQIVPFVTYKRHVFQINDKYVFVNCPKALDYNAPCPLCKEHYNAVDALKAGEGDSEQLDIIAKKFKPEIGYLMLIALSQDPQLYAVRLKTTALGAIFGNPKKQTIGMISQFSKDYDVKWNDPRLPTGWIKVWKTGAGINTTYQAELDATKIKDKTGKGFSTVITEENIDASLLDLVLNPVERNMPRLTEQIQPTWTVEEMEHFVKYDEMPKEEFSTKGEKAEKEAGKYVIDALDAIENMGDED
jgi:hypothetical protein